MKGERELAKIKYKGDEILFNQYMNLKWRVQGLAAAIQQSEMLVDESDIEEWVNRAKDVQQELDRLITLTLMTIEGGETLEDNR
jgi:hypothetical protein